MRRTVFLCNYAGSGAGFLGLGGSGLGCGGSGLGAGGLGSGLGAGAGSCFGGDGFGRLGQFALVCPLAPQMGHVQ
jgi:hypothetical protein